MCFLTAIHQTTIKTPFLHYLARVGLLAVIYIIGGKLGLALASVEGIVTLVWPPTGIALAALLLFGYRLWPGVFLGAFLVNLSTGAPLATVIGISVGNTLEAVAGVYLLHSVADFRPSLERLQDVLNLVSVVMISAIVGATIGTASLCLTGVVLWTAYGSTWWVWWLGDALGALVVAPVLLTWGAHFRLELTPAPGVSSPVKPLESEVLPQQPRSLLEAVVLLVSLIAVSQIAFGGWFAPYLVNVRLSFILLPFLVWAAIRFGQRGAVTATLIGMGIAVWGTAHGFGPFVLETVHLSLIFLGSFMGAAAVMAMLLAAVLAERQRVENALRESQERLIEERSQLKQLTETLEAQVEQRTAQVRTLASVLTLAEQQERNRISQILHDELQQMLYGLQMRLMTLSFQLPTRADTDDSPAKPDSRVVTDASPDADNTPIVASPSEPAALKEQLDKMSETVDQILQATRTLVVELNPPVLQSAGVNEALQWVVSYMKEGYDLNVGLSTQGECQIPDQEIRALLVQMVRELLFNVVKHTGTKEAYLKLWQEGEMLLIRVQDKGQGFDPQSFRDNTGKSVSGFGLFRMEERLNLIGGLLEIESAPGQGTRITLMIPVALVSRK